jgi:hypothetical protein
MLQKRRQFLRSLAFGIGAFSLDGGLAHAKAKSVRVDTREPPATDAPVLIPIDVGRQLFVDDFLIADTTLKRSFHTPRLYEHNPVLKPETPLEMNNGICPVACPFEDGVFYDPKDRLFKMWYHAGWFDGIGYAISEDGLRWRRPTLDVEPGSNRVLAVREGYQRDGATIWLDHEAIDPNQRYKMFAYFRKRARPDAPVDWEGGEVYTSPDGIHWHGPVKTGPCGDNTGFFYNPFRKMWVYSIRSYNKSGRVRSYREHPDFIQGAAWDKKDVVYWVGTDDLDRPDPELSYQPQLYKVSAVAYESLMLGLFAIFKGPPNEVCAKERVPKIIDLTVGFSRDGFHWRRPDRRAFLASSRQKGSWNRAYLHAAGGICLMVGDQIYFYFGAWSGISPKLGGHMYAGGSTGLAILRRDGFASLDAETSSGSLTTHPVSFKGKYLFVNTNTSAGELRVEALDRNNRVIEPFSRANCIPVRTNSTTQRVTWKHKKELSALSGKPVKLRFHLTNGQLYSFWISPDVSGASYGYVAAGGPGLTGPIERLHQ